MEQNSDKNRREQWTDELEKRVRLAVGQIRYGTITLVIQDGRVIQIDKSEKIRIG